MKRKIALFTTLIALSGLAICSNTSVFAQSTNAPVVREHHERHPAIHAAIRELEHARTELKDAAHDFGGHREAAVKECDAAIEQLKLALKYDKD